MSWNGGLPKADTSVSLRIIDELLVLKVDVIVTVTDPMIWIAKGMTRKVPIVMVSSANPVEEGLIESLAQPGGNVTGLTDNAGELDILCWGCRR